MHAFELKGKIVLVSGGCQNFGLEITQGFLKAGATVIISSRNAEKATNKAKELSEKYATELTGLELDLNNEESITSLFAIIREKYGVIDVLVNNAGGHSSKACGYLEKETIEGWNAFIQPNLTGTFLMMREYAKLMMPHRKGNIINIASISSLVGRDRTVYTDGMIPNPVAYTAAKAGLIGLSYDVAAYLGDFNIRVNCVSPGGFERNQPKEFIDAYSNKTMLKRMGHVGDLEGVVIFLASEASSYITGHNLVVDGGFTTFK